MFGSYLETHNRVLCRTCPVQPLVIFLKILNFHFKIYLYIHCPSLALTCTSKNKNLIPEFEQLGAVEATVNIETATSTF